jgi:predicted transcriptional regulator
MNRQDFHSQMSYLEAMANLEGIGIDPFVSREEEAGIDGETVSAIQRGIEDADAGRVITLDEARERMHRWLSKSYSPTQR